MTSLTIAQVEKLSPAQRFMWAWRDMKTVTWRNLLGSLRTPEAIFFSSLQPIMFVLLFRYVFGGAIPVPGGNYVDYLMPGIFVQTVCFGSVATAIGLAEDLQKGLIERFRALPMARSAVLGGRTTADSIRNVVVLVILTVVGVAVGFRMEAGILNFLLGCLVMLVFAYALSWGFSVIGLIAPNSETAQLMTFPLLFPLTFASGAFSPVQAMPGWLRGFATWQPVGTAVSAARSLMVGGYYHDTSKVYWALGWSAVLLVVFSTMAVWIYRKAD